MGEESPLEAGSSSETEHVPQCVVQRQELVGADSADVLGEPGEVDRSKLLDEDSSGRAINGDLRSEIGGAC